MSDVLNLLLAERILLLHSPSGAGKTSLLQAKVIPILAARGFNVSAPVRVNAVPTDGFKPDNRYIWSVIVNLKGGDAAMQSRFASMTLAGFLDEEDQRAIDEGHAARGDSEVEPIGKNRVLIFDQFEEILTLAPGDRENQTEFFHDVGRALRNNGRWAVFSMREDYMGGLARFAPSIPTHLKVRYRIDFLEREEALEATQGPAAKRSVTFADDAARALVNDLAKAKEQLPGQQKARLVVGPYVEPVQLQVVCTELWDSLVASWGAELKNIVLKDITDFGDFDQALGSYYAKSVRKVAAATGASERAIRDWFEERLITEDGLRNQSLAGPDVDVDVSEVLAGLTDEYLVRSDQRGGTWYELAHDRLIDPLCANNREWRRNELDPWEAAADAWARGGRSSADLLGPAELGPGRRWLAEHVASELLREFLHASHEAAEAATRAARKDTLLREYSRGMVASMLIALGEFVLILFLLTRKRPGCSTSRSRSTG